MIALAIALAFATTTTPTPLRVASYNAWLFPFVSDDFARRRDAMPAALAALEPDVLCLQEVWDRGSLAALKHGLGARLPHVYEGGGGLILMSRHPILDAYFAAFADHVGLSIAERIAKKGYIAAVIATPSGFVRVVTTHLAHARGDEREAHRAQLDALALGLADRLLPTIVCADFNFRATDQGRLSEDMLVMTGLGFLDPFSKAVDAEGLYPRRDPTRIGWPREPGRVRGGDPDYVMYRPGATRSLQLKAFRQALDTPETALSDHNLLLVDFLLH